MPYGSRLWMDVPAAERGLEPLPAATVEVLRPCDWPWMPRPDDPMVGWMAEDPFSHKDSIAPAVKNHNKIPSFSLVLVFALTLFCLCSQSTCLT